jgi:uncharacterized protein (DUF305 family)
MGNLTKPLISLALIGSVAACGQSGQQSDAGSGQNEAISRETPVGAASGLFDPAERKMGEAMAAAVGTDVGDNWVRKMIAHHQGAIDMSQVVLEQKPSTEVAKMARMTIDKQGHEIEDLRKLESNGSPDAKSAELYKPAMMQMESAMMAASGPTSSETYMRKMLAHHEGAVAMSDIALNNGVTGRVKSQVEKTKADQQKEVDMVQKMIAKPSM